MSLRALAVDDKSIVGDADTLTVMVVAFVHLYRIDDVLRFVFKEVLEDNRVRLFWLSQSQDHGPCSAGSSRLEAFGLL